ncbi:MAG: glycoside hydrolase family 25 protein [Sediminibacterium sp.]
MQLIVTVKKLNKRSSAPGSFTEKNIIGAVLEGFRFEGEEILNPPNPSLGKWYKDRDGSVYWGGGLIIEPVKIIANLAGMPINLPAVYQLGIDIAHHDENPDWDAYQKAGASFVFIKTSEGVGTRDKKAKDHADNAKAHGFRIGYYHFCRPDTRNGGSVISDATAEANEVLSVISTLQKPGLPLVLDLEDQTSWDTPLQPADYVLWITTFIKIIKDRSGTDPMFYSRTEYLDRKLPVNHGLGNYKLWLSYYPKNPDINKVVCPKGWNDWSLWQYTESGIIGKSKAMDINILKDHALLNDIQWQG